MSPASPFTPLPAFKGPARGQIAHLVEGRERATALAHPIQGLVKYHGLRDAARRIPFHDSVSLCTAPTVTKTTVAFARDASDVVFIDGTRTTGRPLERCTGVLNAIRSRTGWEGRGVAMWSESNFPARVGLGSSSSGFGALAVAAARLMGWKAKLEEVSEAARLGAGSATRAVTGGISEWVTEGTGPRLRSFGRALPGWEKVKLRTVVPLIPADVPTEGMHAAVLTSPLFDARLQYVGPMVDAMRKAVVAGNAEQVAALAERDTLNLHAVTMTSDPPHITWEPPTLAVMKEVWKMRGEGVPAWFSIDTGATPYVNTLPGRESEVADRLRGIPGVTQMLLLEPGGAARTTDEHFF